MTLTELSTNAHWLFSFLFICHYFPVTC